jgi:hypothetical protein
MCNYVQPVNTPLTGCHMVMTDCVGEHYRRGKPDLKSTDKAVAAVDCVAANL